MKRALVVGGGSGIGLAICLNLLNKGAEHIYIVGKAAPIMDNIPECMRPIFKKQTSFYQLNLCEERYDIFDEIRDIDTLVISAGFGRVALFEELTQTEIKNLVKCNELAAIQIIKKYYDLIKSDDEFNCAVMVSISGHVVSPYFSVYGAAKTGLAMFIENINVELNAGHYKNRILDCSPGSLKGTAFNGGNTEIDMLSTLADEIVQKMQEKQMLFIPEYDNIYRAVIERYQGDPTQFGLDSYAYKEKSGRIGTKPQVVIGYLSGTFDLFHIGHLNLLRRAKEQCDYLIVGVHESGSWKGKETFIPFEERCAIIGAICYVDKVVKSYTEDVDAWNELHYDKLFVGSDYKGSERFLRYEEYFKDKGVEIVYFPYTQGTSSTQLREKLKK